MARLLGVDAGVLRVVPLGIRLDQYASGAAAAARRAAAHRRLPRPHLPGEGPPLLVEAFAQLAREPGRESLRLRVAGYLAPKDRSWFAGSRRASPSSASPTASSTSARSTSPAR
jgi:hypothetical protein